MAKFWWQSGIQSVVVRLTVLDLSKVGSTGLTGLTFNSAGLIIATIADNEASATTYTQAGGTVETIATLGTFATPTTSKCRFRELDAANFPGEYELQIADSRWAVSGARSLKISIPPIAGLNNKYVTTEVQLTAVNPQDASAFGLSRLDAAISSRMATFTLPTNFSSLGIDSSGRVLADVRLWLGQAVQATVNGYPLVDLKYILGSILTEGSAGNLAGAFKKWFDKASPTGTINSIPDALPGANGGLPLLDASLQVLSKINAWGTGAVQAFFDSVVTFNAAGSVGKLWNDILTKFHFTGSVGVEKVNSQVADIDTAAQTEIANAVLDAPAASHNTAGTIGALINLISGINLAGIPAAVWNYLTSNLTTPNSIGLLILTKLGLITANNVQVVNPVNPNTGLLTFWKRDDYTVLSGRTLPVLSNDDWAAYDLPNAQWVKLLFDTVYSEEFELGVVTVLDATTVEITATKAQKTDLSVGTSVYSYQVRAKLDVAHGEAEETLAYGQVTVNG